MGEPARIPLFAVVAALLAACSNTTTAGLVESCADAGAPGCLSNADCPSGTRCTVPTNADPNLVITCCLPGDRGQGQAGAVCSGPDACASGVCAYAGEASLCSQACQGDSQCPPGLPLCVTVDAGVRFCGLGP